MAKADIRVAENAAVTPVISFAIDSRTNNSHNEAVKPGEPVKAAGTGNNFMLLLINGEPDQAGSDRFVGIAHNTSTETSTAEGTVDVDTVIPMVTVLEATATTPANVNLESEWRDLQCDSVSLDAIASIGDSTDTTPYTIDENEGDDPNDHAFVMVDWDINRPTKIRFIVKPLVTLFGNNL